MESGQTPPYPPPVPGSSPVTEFAPAATVQNPPAQARRKMSAGAKWAIGLGVAFVALVFFACAGIAYLGLSGPDSGVALGDSIAVIHIDGVIAGTGSVYDGVISPEYVLDQLAQALADDSVKAILLRIDSPGGTVAASQEIAMAVSRASEEKPVVASVGDIGASGAYMVASQCDSIVAAPGSMVGSIGVIMEVPNVSGLLEKLGVEFTVLTEGELKDTGSPYRSVTPTETALLKGQMALDYDDFIGRVADGRGMDEAEVRELATGWAWLGSEAIDLGLVDRLGNWDDAVEEAATLGGIEGEPNLVSYEPTYTVEDLVLDLVGLRSNDLSSEADSLRRLGLPK